MLGCACLGKKCPLSSETPFPWALIRSVSPWQLPALHTGRQSETLRPRQPGTGSLLHAQVLARVCSTGYPGWGLWQMAF